MDFKLTGFPKSIRIFGKIVRSDAKGFAAESYEEINEALIQEKQFIEEDPHGIRSQG